MLPYPPLAELACRLDRLAAEYAAAEVEYLATKARRDRTYRLLSEAHALYTMHPEKDADNAPR